MPDPENEYVALRVFSLRPYNYEEMASGSNPHEVFGKADEMGIEPFMVCVEKGNRLY